MRYKTLRLIRARRIARKRKNRATRWMQYLISSIIIALIVMFAATAAEAKNEYLGQNWRDCYAGEITPWVEYRKG